jgi:PhzF family phenazine biosynthesis protein
MSRTLRIFEVHAFTTKAGGGNPAGVALDAAWLDEAGMQQFATDRHIGDWAFVLPPSTADADLDVRFFSPRKELPFVGHATLALHAVLARSEPKPLRRQRGRTGIVEVRSLPEGAGFSISQPAPALGRIVDGEELREVLALLGLSAAQLDARCPPRIAGGASTRLLLGLADPAVLDAVQPRLPELAALSPRLGTQGYFLFALAGTRRQQMTEARMFCPAIGIDEDPVSGNAHAMLGVYLHELGMLPVDGGVATFTGLQGRHVGRPGEVRVAVQLDGEGRPVSASIAGQAVIVSETELRLP